MEIEYRILRAQDEGLLSNVAPEVFDQEIQKTLAAEFLADPRHHLVVAIAEDQVVGFASAVHYVHPDKAPQLFINEVGVSPQYQGQGVGTNLMRKVLSIGQYLGCSEAWVLTDAANIAAMRLYEIVGGTSTQGHVMFSFDLGPEDSRD